MIGGIVVEVIELKDRTTLEVRDGRVNDRCRVDIIPGYRVEFGDTVWWQGRYVYWTPAGGRGQDRPIPRIGYSYAAEPVK